MMKREFNDDVRRSKRLRHAKKLNTRQRSVRKPHNVLSHTRTTAILRRATRREQRNAQCECNAGCKHEVRFVFHSMPSSFYGGRTILLCNESVRDNTSLLFSNANKIFAAQ